jgi:hypothetical protein
VVRLYFRERERERGRERDHGTTPNAEYEDETPDLTGQ